MRLSGHGVNSNYLPEELILLLGISGGKEFDQYEKSV